MTGLTFVSPRAALRIERILAALVEPMTARQLAMKLYMSHATAKIYLAHLKAKPKRIRVARWLSEGRGQHSPVYGLGDKRGAPKPKKMTGQQKRAKDMARHRVEPEANEAFLAKRRARDWKTRRLKGQPARVPCDPLHGWISST